MNTGRTIFDLPQAGTVPAGSRYIVEMGDGTGTKSVTHEDVVRAVGGDLPLGDTEDLNTVEKGTFVAAINEIKELTDKASGGAVIRVHTTDPGLYGRIVTVTDGETVLTGSMSYTGECIISGVTINGSLTISASTTDDETDETMVDVTSYATYHTVLDTRQTYNRLEIITSDPGLIGKAVTITNGTEMVSTAISNDGRARSVFQFFGMITISASDDFGNVATSEVELTDDSPGSYSVRLMLPGSISDAFSEKVAYKSGQYCIRENALWVFTADKAAGDWDAGKVKKTTVTDALCELNGNIIGIDAIANNLTTTAADMVLDARQGKALNDSKVSTSNVVNNLTTTASGKVLDARQGKALNDKITVLSASGTAGITFTSTTVFTVFGTQLVTKSGKLAHLHLCFKINEGQSVGDGGIFTQIPSGYRPNADYGNIGVRCTAGEATAFSLLKNGNMIANGNWPTGIYVIDFGYVIA